MKCPICGNKLEIKNKQIGTDNSGDPVFNEYAVCRDCKKQWNLDKQRAKKAAAKAARWHIGRADQDAVADAIFDIARSTAAGEMPSFMRGEDAASASDKRSSR